MKKLGFSIAEILVGLVAVSCILVALAPTITQKLTVKEAPVISAGGGGGANVPVGTIVIYLGQTPPEGWLLCDGATFSATKYPKLKAFLGTNRTPDMRGYVPKGATQEDIDAANE